VNLFTDHLAQAEGGAADADVDQLRKGVELQLAENVRDRSGLGINRKDMFILNG
jgi:hypothetical protein